jgi:hypothetical protein
MKQSSAISLVALMCVAGSVHASDVKVIKATSGRPACQTQELTVGSKSAKGKLCVTQGLFSHDEYTFNINRKLVLSGIDDETTQGIVGSYDGQRISMTCKPESKKPEDDDRMVAETTKSLMSKPGVSEQEAHGTAVAMFTIEVGRHCVVEQDSQLLMATDIQFD